MSKGKNSEKGLSARQLRAVALLVSGRTITDTAAEIGVTQKTVHAWKKNELFTAALEGAQDAIFRNALATLKAATEESAAALIKLTKSEDETIRLRAINSQFEIVGRLRQEQALDRLAEIEKRLA